MRRASTSSGRWKRARATVELCARRRRHRDGTRLNRRERERYRYAITFSYPVEGDLYITDVVSNTPLKEGSKVIVQYDPSDPRVNSLNHPRRERRAFRIALIFGALGFVLLLFIALIGL